MVLEKTAHHRRSLRIAVVSFLFALIPFSFIKAPYPEELVLQHVPTFFLLAGLLFAVVKWNMTRLTFGCLVTFLILHFIGARWIYSFVPYDDWIEMITGSTLSERFGWERNHYDRLVHFAFGVLGVPPIAEVFRKNSRVSPLMATFIAISFVSAMGAVYEIMEWLIAVSFAPAYAESYNGQQGDVWDAQKDLALALLGSLLAAAILPFVPPNVEISGKT